MTEADGFSVRAARPSDADGLAALFARTGSPCHCRWWHFTGDKNAWLDRCANAPELNQREMRAALAAGSDEMRGVVALAPDRTLIGWMKLAPAEAVDKLHQQRVYKGLPCLSGPRSGVLTVGCFLVDEAWRSRGVAHALLAHGIELGREAGATAIEAFPRRAEGVRAEELWTGPLGVFARAGFVEIHPQSQYPVLLRTLGAALALGLAVSAAGCARCSSSKGSASDAAASNAAREGGPSPNLFVPPHLEPPRFTALPGTTGYGIPPGCRFDGPIRRATLPEGRVRFAAGRHALDELVLATGAAEDAGPLVRSAASVVLGTGALGDAPWAELDAPPLFERAKSGWLATWATAAEPGVQRALAWHAGNTLPVADGDQLEVIDAECRDDRCVVLTTLARAAAAPGATLFSRDFSVPGAAWQRVDLEAARGEPWRPVSVAASSAADASWVALGSGAQVALWQLEGKGGVERHRWDAPHGVYDAVLTSVPVAVVPDAPRDRPCGPEEFPIAVLTPGGRHVVRTPGAPESVFVRPIGRGALVGWVAPVACQHLERRVVHALLLDQDGKPVSTPMGITDGTGFALATDGDRLSLWVLSGRELSWIAAKCSGTA